MTDKQLRKMILAVICEADYDLAKSFGCGAEDPALAKQTMQAMIGIARKHVAAIAAAAAKEEREACAALCECTGLQWGEAGVNHDALRNDEEARACFAKQDAAVYLWAALRSRGAAGGGEK